MLRSRTTPRRWLGAIVALVLAVTGSVVAAQSATAAGTTGFEGHVRTGSTALYNIEVSIVDDSGTELASARTDSAGFYDIDGIVSGTLVHIFVDGGSNGGPYVSEWYNSQYSLDTADNIYTAAGVYTGVDFDLEAGASISGHVTMEVPSTGVVVIAYRYVGGVATQVGIDAVDGAGNYTITGIKPSTSTFIEFTDYTNVLVTQYYDNKPTLDAAFPIFFTGTGDYPNVNAAMLAGPGPEVERISGSNRYATSAAVSAKFASLAQGVVFVASGANFPDALSAAPAAAFYGAPLLLTDPNVVPQVILNELTRLHPDTIVIVGGTSVVSENVATQLQAIADVHRIAGANRYDTSRRVVDASFAGVITTTDGFVATGTGFADALSLSGLAALRGGPVLLIPGQDAAIDSDSADLLHDLGTADLYVAGGPAAVSTSMENSLGEIPSISTVTRLSGANRYATSVAINGEFVSADFVYLATGSGFADALSGAALAGVNKSPLYVVPQNCIPQDVLDEITRLHPQKIFLLGGEVALGAGVFSLTPCA